MELQFAEEYTHRSNDELVRLWSERTTLVPEARDALALEIQNRRLNLDAELERFSKRARAEDRREWRKQANAVKEGYQQGGRGRVGRANYTFNSNTGHEEFDSTEFIFVAHFPLIPVKAYRVQRSPKMDRTRILREVPISWPNVRLIWARAFFIAAGILLLLTFAWRYWLAH
jgi:hypothetical protein